MPRPAPGPDHGVPQRGAVAPVLVEEYLDLDLWHATVRAAPDAARSARERLARLSDGYRGADVVHVHGRTRVHEGYRAFARQIGLDPDRSPLAADRAARDAVAAGRLVSRGAVPDALLAVAATAGVAVTALDARTVDGDLRLRLSADGETLGGGRRGRGATALPPSSIVVADGRRPVALLLADPPAAHDGSRARDVVLYAVAVPGVPPVEVSEAVWTAARYLDGT